jgi:hypothetical protein
MNAHERAQKTKEYLYTIMRNHGVVYTLGLCIGILCRLSKDDFQIYLELKHRSEDPAVNTRSKR